MGCTHANGCGWRTGAARQMEGQLMDGGSPSTGKEGRLSGGAEHLRQGQSSEETL